MTKPCSGWVVKTAGIAMYGGILKIKITFK